MGTRNPFLSIAINNKRTDLTEKRNHRTVLMNELAEVAFLRNFISAWANQGYQAAIDSLPDDDPSTPDVDESVSIDDIKELADKLFGSDWFPDTSQEAEFLKQWVEDNKQFVRERVMHVYGQIRSMDMQISDIETDIKDLEAIQKNDGKNIA